ncbi:A-agglutinin anchorage subunit-like isoform X1 [Trichogramma pretiosum]|uniref:A-agglutinin anchorage subunit-like isoform X1 n=1 Tax=Trichogramma pretiosum TaxID=7493 RepID=UPI0006C94962|nr:A-agglutinin anchorage subunit-like isoform X1 [Trichogramma pretiosum]
MSGNENPADKAKQDALYEDREPKKIIRLITVTAYMVSVSFVGIVLSIYYVFLWHPPNTRLMHAQAQAEHHERLEGAIEYLRQELDHQRPSSSAPLSIKLPVADPVHAMTLADVQPLDVFYGERHSRQENSSSKTRREILKNFNAILSANFDRTKSTSEATSTIMDTPGESGLSSDSSQSATVTKHNGVIVASEEESFTTAETTTITTPSTTMTTTTTTSPTTRETVTFPASMTTRSIKKTRLTAKKPHQTPFALKHLEVPIQSDSIKRRQGGSISTPNPTLFYSTQETMYERTGSSDSPLPATTSNKFNEGSERARQQQQHQGSKSLLKILTTLPSSHSQQDDIYYPKATDPPIIGGINEDYRDATMLPAAEDLLDD